MISDPAGFIRDHTRLQRPPHVPEMELWLADEITPIWRLTEDELGKMGIPPPFWAFAWAGGQAVARWVLDNPREALGREVLDLATGSGMVAIACRIAGAASAMGADIDPLCATAVALNAQANGVTVEFTAENLLERNPPDVELICAGDVFYEKPLAERAHAWLERAHRAGTRVLLGDPGRSYFDRRGLVQLAEYKVATTRELEDAEVKKTGVWTFA